MKKYILSIIIALWLFPFALMAKGHIEYVEMPTKSALNNRPLMVYVPQDYYDDDDQDITYPVLFLLHGLHGDETSWTRKGDLFTSIDSVIDNDIIRPCIIIMPNTNGGKYIWRAEEHSLFYCVMHYGETKRNNFVDYFSEIMNYAAKHYRISNQCEDHALAGLSNGGRKAAELAILNPMYFGYVGLFSPVLSKQQVPDRPISDYYISIGVSDLLAANGRRFHKNMDKKGIPHTFCELEGGHDWPRWKQDILDFLEYAFPK